MNKYIHTSFNERTVLWRLTTYNSCHPHVQFHFGLKVKQTKISHCHKLIESKTHTVATVVLLGATCSYWKVEMLSLRQG